MLARRLDEDALFRRAIGIGDVDLHQEAVELRFRERVGAFLLQRVLRREDMEGRGQIMPLAGDGHMVLLHGLQQRRLRAGGWRG